MAAEDLRAGESATYFGTESTYGTAATTARGTIVTGSFQPKLMQTELPVLKESTLLHDNQTTVQGLKSDGSGSSTEPAKIASIASTTLTCNPGLSAAPAGSGNVAHMVSFYPSDTNTSSVTVQHAKAGSSSEQYEFLGCTGNISLALARNAEVTVGFDLQAANWRQGALSLATTVGNDGRGAPFAVVGAKTLLQAYGTATATNYHVEECSVDLKLGMTHLPSLSGTVEGTAGVMRTGERIAAEINLTVRMDTTWVTGWSAQTLYQFMIAIPSGTGATKQWLVFHAPKCQIVGVPERDFGADGRVRYKLKLLPQIDSAGANAAMRAPWSLSIG